MHLKNARGRLWVCVAMMMLLQACATPGAMGDLGQEEDPPDDTESGQIEAEPPPPWETRSEAANEAARRSEVATAVAGMRGVANTQEDGAELVFRFWVQNGALTLLAWKRTALGTSQGGATDAFVPGLEANLLTYLDTLTGEMLLTFRRQPQGWRLHAYSTASAPKPLEAKTLPVRRTGVTAETLAQAHAVASRLAKGLQVPEGGSTLVLAEVYLDDDRVLDAALVRHESHDGPPGRRPSPGLETTLTQILLPFTQGVGPRTVRLKLDANHPRGQPYARWRVVEAETPHSFPLNSHSLVNEHYALYERVLREWREETDAAFMQAGLTSAEFLATWFVSGLALRGGQVLLEALAPRLAPMLARGGAEAVAWFRSFLARVRPADKEKFQRLWMKAQTRGLSAAERNQLQKLMSRFERLLDEPLNIDAKRRLRADAHAMYFEKFHPTLSKLLVDEGGKAYAVHHRIPLEFAHLFSKVDINAKVNLKGVHPAVHERINNLWTAFRPMNKKATARDVEEVANIIDKQFGRWYDKVYDSSRSLNALDDAESRAVQ